MNLLLLLSPEPFLKNYSLPPEIGSLSHLQNLVLYSNELTNLPPEIGNLSHLYTLVLSHNNLHSLPAEVGNLSKLCYLDTGYNQLQHLPTELAQLESLRGMNCEMNVDGNPLISPPQEVIDGGTPAILDYLENQALWHLKRLLIGIASGIGIIVVAILALLSRRRGQRKPKQKREENHQL